ncbi:MAG: hypothetical protein QW794_06975 [Thermosphaera sp.]
MSAASFQTCVSLQIGDMPEVDVKRVEKLLVKVEEALSVINFGQERGRVSL